MSVSVRGGTESVGGIEEEGVDNGRVCERGFDHPLLFQTSLVA